MRFPPSLLLLLALFSATRADEKPGASLTPLADKGSMVFHSLPDARFRFSGAVGERISANIEQWLLRAPAANPGMLEMFRVRDRLPVPQVVPWAGEFAGKYLLSCVQALRLSDRVDLRKHVTEFVRELLATQADDGYLGPFAKARRLLGEWDLWGHYHILQGLLLWHDFAGDSAALAAARKAADLICHTYLDGTRRVFDAGSPEMNMAVSHVLADLHRRTGEPRYLRLVREIEKDWERTGDYARTGAQGVPFFKTPRPRWESLHDLQTLAALWRITGEARYREAFVSHWRTIRAFDVRNSGAFSGGEQATGNAFAPSAIETCCTVAWMALSIDMLRLTGDPRVADELELSTINAALGAQHPSGRWWTYNTPMDGDRKASAHDIVFQARAGTPELNCCSVNGPRALGMLSEWAVMRAADALVVNWHGPLEVDVAEAALTLKCDTRYPLDGRVVWRVRSDAKQRVKFRVPGWATGATAKIAGAAEPATPGTYLEVERIWREADAVEFEFPMPLRALSGEREQAGKVSLYRGPLLLAYDQRDNPFDEIAIPRLDLAKFGAARLVEPEKSAPWLLVEIPTATKPLRVRDFASAGMSGTRYRSWLRVAGPGRMPGPEALLIRADLHGDPQPQAGQFLRAAKFTRAENGVRLNGRDEMLGYVLPENFGGDCTVAVRVRINALPPEKQLGQIFSAWCAPGDDPLRLVVENGQLFARIEAAKSAGTAGIPLEPGEWHHVAAVKAGPQLTLYVDGEACSSTEAPATVVTHSRACALGGNPLFTGAPEFLAADFAGLMVYGRALSDIELAGLSDPAQ